MSENDTQSELQRVLAEYDLGKLVQYAKDQRGFVNTSFSIALQKNNKTIQYFLRRYKNSIKEEEIQYEHSIIRYLQEQGFDLIANLYETKRGKTYVKLPVGVSLGKYAYYAIFQFLNGEDRYTWINPRCTQNEIASSAKALAKFHQAVYGLVPEGKRYEPKIIDMRPVILENALQCSKLSKIKEFDDCWRKNARLVKNELERVYTLLDCLEYQRLPQVVNHCDYHPGNLKFEGESVVGLFDFDWSKMDVRIFDVALSLFYFFVSWDGVNDGVLRLDDMKRFLTAYQEAFANSNKPGALSRQECGLLPAMIAASNLYVLNWTIVDYINKEVDPEDYLKFLHHGVNTIVWLSNPDNWNDIVWLLKSICTN